MKNSVRIGIAALLFCALVMPVMATGQMEGGDGAPAGKLPMRYVVPGNAPQELDAALAAVNDKLVQDGLNLDVEVVYIPWDAWDQRTNIMLSTGEPFELFHVMENRLPTQTFAARGALTPIDDLLEDYGDVLLERFTENEWSALQLEGQIYSVPARWRQTAGYGGPNGSITARADLLEKYGLPMPTNAEELLDIGEELQQRVKDDLGETWYFWDHEMQVTPVYFFRTLDNWPFYVDYAEEIIYIDQDGNVEAYFETEEFRMAADFQREMYVRGLRHPDILSVPRDLKSQATDTGRYLFGLGTGPLSSYPTIVQLFPDAELEQFYLAEDKPFYETLPVWNSNSVPSTTDQPQAGIEFLNWLYASDENHDLFLYGIPGEHYEPVGENRMTQVRTEGGQPVYAHPFWQTQFIPFANFGTDALDALVDSYLTPMDNIENAINVGFVFDKEPVSAEWANVLAEREASMYPIKWGVVSFEDHFDEAIGRMRAAGLDKIVEEYQRQFDEWRAEQ